MPLTLLEAAALSRDVYREDERPSLPPGWQLLFDCPIRFRQDYDYFAAVYVKSNSDGQYDVVIANRGTNSLMTESVLEDLYFYLDDQVPAQFLESAVPFVKMALKKIATLYDSSYTLTFVGHSLGAMLSDLCVAKWSTYRISPQGISLGCPGTKTLLQKMVAQGDLPRNAVDYVNRNVITFNGDVSIINSCYPHIGRQEHLIPHFLGSDQPVSPYWGQSFPPTMNYFAFVYSLEDHHIIRIHQYLLNAAANNITDSELEQPEANFSWPIGINAAYDHYLTFPNDHSRYWEESLQYYWERNPSIQASFNSFASFRQNAISTYLESTPTAAHGNAVRAVDFDSINGSAAHKPSAGIVAFAAIFVLAKAFLELGRTFFATSSQDSTLQDDSLSQSKQILQVHLEQLRQTELEKKVPYHKHYRLWRIEHLQEDLSKAKSKVEINLIAEDLNVAATP